MKRLFQVGTECFDTKVAAKAARGPFVPGGLTVARGPDHWFQPADRKVGTTHSNGALKKK